MKSFVPSLIVLALAAVLSFGGAKPSPVVDVPAVIDVAASPSPLCDCEPCKCDPCDCKLVSLSECKLAPLVVGPPPDAAHIKASPTQPSVVKGSLEQVKFTQPQPVAPKPAPKAVAAPAQFYGSCGPGGCGTVRRGLFGRRR
jgi:hypothetical protein